VVQVWVPETKDGVILIPNSAVMNCAPHHLQTNGKIERFHETLKPRMNLLVYTSPDP
jgi:hypothetical protein